MLLKILRRLSVAAVTLAVLSACGMTYLGQAARGQLGVMRAREPIDKVLADPATPEALRVQLEHARRIREFASRQLGLPDNDSYRSYADIGRPYVVWNVVAAPEFSVEPRQWCFPIAGCVAYRGYFKEAAARKFAARLAGQGDDVMVGGVPAYSTLGHIADPLLSTVAGYPELDLAGLVFHELAHQEAYLPGDSAWNEAFATVVEEAGVARYAAKHADAATLARWRRRRQMDEQVVTLFVQARAELERLYRTRIAAEAMRRRKARRLTQLAADIRALEQREGLSSGYGKWLDAGINNAHLAAVATYHDREPHFEEILNEQCGGYLPCLYVAARQEIAAQKQAPP